MPGTTTDRKFNLEHHAVFYAEAQRAGAELARRLAEGADSDLAFVYYNEISNGMQDARLIRSAANKLALEVQGYIRHGLFKGFAGIAVECCQPSRREGYRSIWVDFSGDDHYQQALTRQSELAGYRPGELDQVILMLSVAAFGPTPADQQDPNGHYISEMCLLKGEGLERQGEGLRKAPTGASPEF